MILPGSSRDRAGGGFRERPEGFVIDTCFRALTLQQEFCSIAHWVDGESDGVHMQMLGDEKPSTAGGGRTIGQVCDVFSPAHAKPSKPLWLLSLPQGRLATPSGVAITADGQVVTETAWDLEQLRLSLPAASRLRTPAHLTGTHASLISLWSENYFHWMLDALPRYAVLERSGLAGEATLIIPERLNGFQAASLARLGISLEKTSPYRRQHVQADTLLVPSPAAHTGNPSPWVVSWLRDRLGPRQVQQPRRRLYVSRAATKTRRVVNEKAALATPPTSRIRVGHAGSPPTSRTDPSLRRVVGRHRCARSRARQHTFLSTSVARGAVLSRLSESLQPRTGGRSRSRLLVRDRSRCG